MKKNLKPTYDPEADVLYFLARKGPIEKSVEAGPGITLEYDRKGCVVGLEILHASKVMGKGIIASIHARQSRDE
ncbi:MAG: DUF2283 domain-containing protein [Candidatus Omnitrophica bacterium]|nr:DUF2283 domain-containing protein [Candidatus Omnitrophota bacterium]